MLKVIVGSGNPSKLTAVKTAFHNYEGQDINIIPVDNIGIDEPANTNQEIRAKTINKTNELEMICNGQKVAYDYLVSLEGAYLKVSDKDQYTLCACACVRNQDGLEFLGFSSYNNIPEDAIRSIEEGRNPLPQALITRENINANAISNALTMFINRSNDMEKGNAKTLRR